jgi:hypothetical protein
MPDSRVKHFWDEKTTAGLCFAPGPHLYWLPQRRFSDSYNEYGGSRPTRSVALSGQLGAVINQVADTLLHIDIIIG